jgi:hypothetical protein
MPYQNTDVAPPRERANEGVRSRRYTHSGALRATPHDLERSRRHGTMNNPGPQPYFGPVNTYHVDVDYEFPHRCIECGRRDHAAVDCPNIARLLSALDR